ncbi:MAG: D-alanyl-D-alanine carboxypeptidase/D-alanyl-D-alanine-endopeptidase [Candidatus Protochlamydia sp.]|nr:D-alanyl-D-alanine carboxypeptidase/D-alanyl-D-alanine-endopeptidase [Candidatus Protochlamydia sp.]
MYRYLLPLMLSLALFLSAAALPKRITSIMDQPKYAHASWGFYAKDSKTGNVLLDYRSNELFLPASTTKLFSVAALLHAYGENYRFKTPVYAIGLLEKGVLKGSLVLVAQGDLTLGGRQNGKDAISFTPLDHIIANIAPGVTLTKEDPLYALNELAKQIRQRGIKQIEGDILIDDRLFTTVTKRDMALSPMMLNENLIDIIISPSSEGQPAYLTWRPMVPGYRVINEVISEKNGEEAAIEIMADETGREIRVKGIIPVSEKELVRAFSVQDPLHFARAAFILALQNQGIVTSFNHEFTLPTQEYLNQQKPAALWVSPPLSEYAKLILKVSHNLGADLIPLLLAVKNGGKTFEEGMLELGKFAMHEVKLKPGTFVLADAAGGDNNRFTPQAEVQLLDYILKWPQEAFEKFYQALPILGIDGSLADFARNTEAVGKVRAKPGTGLTTNFATNQFLLTTQALTGFVEAKNGNFIEFMIVVNNGSIDNVLDVLPIFEDQGQIAAILFDMTD